MAHQIRILARKSRRARALRLTRISAEKKPATMKLSAITLAVVAAFRQLREFYRRNIVADVPIEMDMCLDCGELECSGTRFANCPRRKARAADKQAERR
jgi:hypothetical protein